MSAPARNTQSCALVVDDERDIRELLVLTLGRMGLRCDTASSLHDARALLRHNAYALCLTDMRLTDGSGLDLVREISQLYPQTPVAMITAFGNQEAAVGALKAGAFDFVSKPVDLSVLRGLVQHALKLGLESAAGGAARPADAPGPAATRLLGSSMAMADLRTTLTKVARSQAPVYIAGESGVGKELVARTIHDEGMRASGPFVPVNCGAIPAELMESEFFGHKKGSFTGAHADKPGLFQAAEGGTLFLDEVAELPLAMQVKLLRAIQEKSIRPVGANGEVRSTSASYRPPTRTWGRTGRGRPLPPRPLLPHQRHRTARAAAARTPRGPAAAGRCDPGPPGDRPTSPTPVLHPDAVEALARYNFPGNVRELENILERAFALADDDGIRAADLRLPEMRPSRHRAAATAAAAPPWTRPASTRANPPPAPCPASSRKSSARRSNRR